MSAETKQIEYTRSKTIHEPARRRPKSKNGAQAKRSKRKKR